MKSSKALLDQDELVVEVEIAVPPERVFQALTDAKQLFAWWGKEPSVELSVFEMDARPGGRWRFQCKPAAGAGHGPVGEQLRRNGAREFEAHGEVLEYVPPRLLVWSWVANWHEHPAHPTTVRWDLARCVAVAYSVSRGVASGSSIQRAVGIHRPAESVFRVHCRPLGN